MSICQLERPISIDMLLQYSILTIRDRDFGWTGSIYKPGWTNKYPASVSTTCYMVGTIYDIYFGTDITGIRLIMLN